MRVFLLPAGFRGERHLELEGKSYRYLIKVLRLREGAQFPGRDAQGNLWDLLLNRIDTGKRSCTVTCTEHTQAIGHGENSLPPQEALPEIHLYQSVLKGKKLDTLIRQAVEMGVSRIIPVQSDYSVPDYMGKEGASRMNRWKVIRDEALQQCGSPILTEIAEPIRLSGIQDDWAGRGLGVFFHQEELSPVTLQGTIQGYVQHTGSIPAVALVIGPEGGLSDDEVECMKKAGFKPAFLKTNILRAETAALYAAACTQMILTELEP